MKKLTALFLAILMLCSLLAGCGASKNLAMDNESPIFDMAGNMAPESADGIYDTTSNGSSAPVTDRKLIRRVTLDVETEELDALLSGITAQVSQLGGYIESRNVYSGSNYSSYRPSRSANLVVRIPKDQLDAFVLQVEIAGNVTSSNETSDDVTLSYVATQSRMTALQKEEARLLELIDKAANLTELLELEKRLTEVRTELEQVTSQLLVYDNLVDYGTVTLNIREVQTLTPVEEPGFWSRIGSGFMNSLSNLWHFLKELAIFLVVALPYLVPLGLVVLILVLCIRRSCRKKKAAKKQPPFPTEPNA